MRFYVTNRKVAGVWHGKRTTRKVYISRDGSEYVNAGSLSAAHPRWLISLNKFMEFVDDVHEVVSDDDMSTLDRYFCLQYERLYEHEDGFNMEHFVSVGNTMINNHSPLVAAFVKYRGDFLSSDREVAAFVMASQVWS